MQVKKKDQQPINNIDGMNIVKKYNLDICDSEDAIRLLPQLSQLTENLVTYICGFVIRRVKKIVKCPLCTVVLEDFSSHIYDDNNFMLLNRKDRGNLLRPSKDAINICLYTDKNRFIDK